MPITVNFTDASTPGSAGPIVAWAWDFGDGDTSTLQNPSHAYAVADDYLVVLVVVGTTTDGIAFITKTVRVA
jgi:PKD repeat protein